MVVSNKNGRIKNILKDGYEINIDFELTDAQKDVLDRIDKFIKDDSKDCDKLLTLSGVAGSGKTSIMECVTLRREKMYEFLERLIRVALPRIRDFKGIESKLDGRGNYTLGIDEQIIFPEINIDSIQKLLGMNITFVTSAKTDEEGYALLREFGLPFKNVKR